MFCNLVTRDASTGAITNLLQGRAEPRRRSRPRAIDTTLRYDFSNDAGQASPPLLDASYLESFKTTSPNPAGGAPIVDERAGKGDQPRSTYPHWKGQASFSWTKADPWNALWRGRYIGGDHGCRPTP